MIGGGGISSRGVAAREAQSTFLHDQEIRDRQQGDRPGHPERASETVALADPPDGDRAGADAGIERADQRAESGAAAMFRDVVHQVRDEDRIRRAEAEAEEHRRNHEHRLATGDGQQPHSHDDHRQAGHDHARVPHPIGVTGDKRPRRDNREAEHREIQRPRQAELLGVDRDEAGDAAVAEGIQEQGHGADQDAPFDQI